MKRDVLLLTLLGISGVFMISMMAYRRAQGSVLGTSRVTALDRDFFEFTATPQFPNFYEPMPGKTYTDKPDWLRAPVTYSINAAGFNSTREYETTKSADVVRIVTLGDSFTYGLFVNTPENYSSVLERSLNNTCKGKRYEVLNLGMPGYDVGFSAERFRLHGYPYHPDLVIWFLNHFTMTFPANERIAIEKRIAASMTKEDREEKEKEGDYYYPSSRSYEEILKEHPINETISREIGYLSDFSAFYSGPLVIAANRWTDWPDYARLGITQFSISRHETWLDMNIPMLSGTDLLADKHPSPAGHAKIAQHLQKFLSGQSLIPCLQ